MAIFQQKITVIFSLEKAELDQWFRNVAILSERLQKIWTNYIKMYFWSVPCGSINQSECSVFTEVLLDKNMSENIKLIISLDRWVIPRNALSFI